MNNTTNYLKHAELALASYASLIQGEPNVTELRKNGMTASQAIHFSEMWRVADWVSDSSSGLFAAVLEDLSNGKRYLSIRGTQPTDAGDIATDLFIVFTGYEINLSAQYRLLKTKVGEWLADGTLQAGFTVSGHSLGGFLATGLIADFSSSVSHAYLYNAPGLNGILGGATAPILRAFGITAPVDSSRISNIKADAGLSPIAGMGSQVAPPVWIGIENQFLSDVVNPPVARNHAQEVLTDALAIYAAYGALMPQLTVEVMAELVRSASVQNKTTLESALDALRVMILNNTQATTEGDRDDFYRNLYELQQHDRYKSLEGSLIFQELSALFPDTLAATAKEDFGSFLALNYLLPFAVDTDFNVLAQAHPELYSAWLDDQTKRASGQINLSYSDNWLSDRAALLIWRNEYFFADGNVVLRGAEAETYIFESRTLDEPDLSLTVAGRQMRSVVNPARVVFGSAGPDSIAGSDLNIGDRLYAGDGDDTLIAGHGNDHLEGGNGFDTYIIEAGTGFNVIWDTDGAGRIVIDGIQTGNAYEIADNLYISGDRQFEYYFDGDLASSGTLFINGDVQIEGFRNGDLGIDLSEENIISIFKPDAFSANPGSEIEWGTEQADFYSLEASGNYYLGGGVYYDRIFLGFGGNDLVTFIDGVPIDSDPSPSFYGGDGDDVLYTNSQYHGHIVGGRGKDIIVGGRGDDFLYGDIDFGIFSISVDYLGKVEFSYIFGLNRAGNEPFFTYVDKVGQYWDGESGDEYGDEIYFEGGVEEALRWFGFFSPLGEPGANNDYVYGGDGIDVIFGGSGHDILYGGEGDDELYGGVGYRSGEVGIQNASLLFNFTYFWKQAAYGFTYEAGNDFLDGGAGNDILMDADGGSDHMLGGEGDDWLEDASYDVMDSSPINYLDGGAGNDVIFTRNPFSEGFDVLVGGEGNDFLMLERGRADLNGGSGNDVYRVFSYFSSAMEVTIDNFDIGGFDTLVLPTSYLLSDQKLLLIRDEENLYFRHPEHSHSVTVLNWFAGADYKIDRILFDDIINPWNSRESTVLSLDIEAVEAMFGTGSSGSDFLWGTRGNDYLQAFAGDDYLNGDVGDDVLEGGEGNDTYVFNSKSGWDTVSDASGGSDSFVIHGVTPNNVQVVRAGDLLQLFLGSLQRGISIQWQPEIGYAIESIQFDDGTIWDTIELESKVLVGNVSFPTEDEALTTDENDESAQAEIEFDGSFSAEVIFDLGAVNASTFFNPDNHTSELTEIDNIDSVGSSYPTNSTFSIIDNEWDANVATVTVREDKDQNFIIKNLFVPSYSESINELIENWFFPKSLLAPLGSGGLQNADLELGNVQAKSSQREIASEWRKAHQQLDFLSRNDNSSLELGEPDLHLGFGGGYATDTRFGLQGLAISGISGHGMPVFSRPFEGLREGLVPIA